MNKNNFIQLGFEQKGFDEEKQVLKIKGFASTKNADRYGDIVEPSAFAKSIELFMSNPVMLLQHNNDKPIGRFTRLAMTLEGLEVEGEVLHNDDGVIDKIKSGVLQAFSIGYIPKKWEIKNPEGVVVANEEGMQNGFPWEAKWDKKNTRTITELELIEISVVSIPANAHSLFSIEASTKSFFDSLEEDWKNEMKNLEETSEASEKQEEITEENSDIPPSGDELVDTDNVANEVLSSQEKETEAVENTAETSENSEKSMQSEEKSFEKDEKNSLNICETSEYKALQDEMVKHKNLAIWAVSELEKTQKENEELKNILSKIPMRKGLATLGNSPAKEKQKSFIETLIDEANNA